MLGKNISYTQWRALLLLVIGCVLVASPAIDQQSSSSSKAGDTTETIFGLGALLIMVSLSGFSAAFFESILKDEKEKCSIWERNFQLSSFSIILLFIYNYADNFNSTTIEGVGRRWFEGWTINTVLICVIQASGGLLVAATLKYADAVIKTLVTAGSIVLSAVFGHYLLSGILNLYVALGCLAVILAIFNYVF